MEEAVKVARRMAKVAEHDCKRAEKEAEEAAKVAQCMAKVAECDRKHAEKEAEEVARRGKKCSHKGCNKPIYSKGVCR